MTATQTLFLWMFDVCTAGSSTPKQDNKHLYCLLIRTVKEEGIPSTSIGLNEG
jgi:hypothetical protein